MTRGRVAWCGALALGLGLSVVSWSPARGDGDAPGDEAPSELPPPAEPPPLAQPWPPVKGQPFPDVTLHNTQGELVALSSFRGKVIVVEPIGISCAACNAFAGAAEKGGFRGAQPQQGLPSFEALLRDYTKLRLDRARDLVYVQLLLYDMSASRAPSLEDAREWAAHFDLNGKKNTVVLVGNAQYVNQASYNMVPGFYVIDRSFVLRGDATGHNPRDGYDTALGLIPALLKERRPR